MRTPTAKIRLTRGFVAIIDKSDLELVSPYKWRAIVNGGRPYAVASVPSNRRKSIYMHRLISGAQPSCYIRFNNSDSLDCRRKNLFPTPPQGGGAQ